MLKIASIGDRKFGSARKMLYLCRALGNALRVWGETSRGRNEVELEGVALGPKGRFAMQRTLTRVRPREGITKWSWRELNPRPNRETIRFLHAYLGLHFRATARPKPPTATLSSKVSSHRRGARATISDFPAPLSPQIRNHILGAMSRPPTL